MNNVLVQYMKNRLYSNKVLSTTHHTKMRPVITISREYGCPTKSLVEMLCTSLNNIESENYTNNHWQWVGKKILLESAKELNLQPKLINTVIKREENNVVEDIINSLSHRHYPGDYKIKKTIGEVIRSFATEGHVIVIGRGGVSITKNIPSSLHIKLQAPLEWRVNKISKNQMISLTEARNKIQLVDTERRVMREFFEDSEIDDSSYDVVFNYMTLEKEDIVVSILRLLESRDLV